MIIQPEKEKADERNVEKGIAGISGKNYAIL